MAKKFKLEKAGKDLEISIQFDKSVAGYIDAWHSDAGDPGQTVEQFVAGVIIRGALLFRREMIEAEINREQAALAAVRSDETNLLRKEANEAIKAIK